MNPIVLYFADGTSFFIGLVVVLLANLLLLRFREGPGRGVLTVLTVMGVIFVAISATPLPLWSYAVWCLATAAALIAGNVAACTQKVRLALTGLVLVATAGLTLAELPFHRLPLITVPRGTAIYVLGDSISAGMGTKDKCWPQVLTETTPLSVVNLAQMGATVQSALKQADGIVGSNAVVIVEIGGNDMIEGVGAAIFRDQLDLLLASLRSRQHQVIMLELPLFPFENAIGKAQRDLAAKHGVSLIPKHCFAVVLGIQNGTLDGLHLSQEGHNAMAELIARVVRAPGEGTGPTSGTNVVRGGKTE